MLALKSNGIIVRGTSRPSVAKPRSRCQAQVNAARSQPGSRKEAREADVEAQYQMFQETLRDRRSGKNDASAAMASKSKRLKEKEEANLQRVREILNSKPGVDEAMEVQEKALKSRASMFGKGGKGVDAVFG